MIYIDDNKNNNFLKCCQSGMLEVISQSEKRIFSTRATEAADTFDLAAITCTRFTGISNCSPHADQTVGTSGLLATWS